MSEPIEGIIIRAYPSREADLVLRVLSRNLGKLSHLAKSARRSRKRFGATLDILDRGNFEITAGRSSLAVVERFTSTRPLKKLRSNLTKITCATVLCDAADLLTHEGAREHEDLFDGFSLALDAIDDAPGERDALKACHIGLAHLLRAAGFGAAIVNLPPSAHHLAQLLGFIEQCAERRLESKSALTMLLSDLVHREQAGSRA